MQLSTSFKIRLFKLRFAFPFYLFLKPFFHSSFKNVALLGTFTIERVSFFYGSLALAASFILRTGKKTRQPFYTLGNHVNRQSRNHVRQQ